MFIYGGCLWNRCLGNQRLNVRHLHYNQKGFLILTLFRISMRNQVSTKIQTWASISLQPPCRICSILLFESSRIFFTHFLDLPCMSYLRFLHRLLSLSYGLSCPPSHSFPECLNIAIQVMGHLCSQRMFPMALKGKFKILIPQSSRCGSVVNEHD